MENAPGLIVRTANAHNCCGNEVSEQIVKREETKKGGEKGDPRVRWKNKGK